MTDGPAANRQVVTDLFERAFDGGDLDAVRELVANDFVNHTMPPGTRPDREGLVATIEGLRAAFADLRYTVVDVVASGEAVVVRSRPSGTHTGSFAGIAPTGRRFEMDAIHMFRLRDGLVQEHWGVHDDLGMLAQLGVAPPRAHPSEAFTPPTR